MHIIFLTKHQPELVDTIDPYSLSTREFLKNVSYRIKTAGEKTRALHALKKFTRPVGQSFSASITNFEALLSFYIQLDNVDNEVPAEETNRLPGHYQAQATGNSGVQSREEIVEEKRERKKQQLIRRKGSRRPLGAQSTG